MSEDEIMEANAALDIRNEMINQNTQSPRRRR